MGQRYSDLEEVYNQLVAINFDYNQLPATSKYRMYKEWKQDPEKRKNPGMPNTGRKVSMGVLAFGYPTTNDDHKLIVRVGERTRGQWDSLDAALKSSTGLVADPDGTYNIINGFSPAKVIVAQRVTATSETSGITGAKYRKSTGPSYTIPFGRTAATDVEFERQAAIISAFDETHVVTFLPEKIVRR